MLDFITIIPWTMVAQICNVIILYFILKKFLFGRVLKVFEARKANIEKTYAVAEGARAEADALKTKYGAAMDEAKNDAERILKTARERAGENAAQIISLANEEAEYLRKKADDEISRSRKKAADSLADETAGLVFNLASKVLKRELDEKAHRVLIDESLGGGGDRP